SDFRGEPDWEAPLRALRGRHGVLACEIRDPREQELVPAGDLWLVDPETGRQLQVNTRRKRVRERFAAAAAADRDAVAQTLRRAGADHLVLSTEGDWLQALARHLRRGEASLRAGAQTRAAVARPQRTVASPQRQATIVMVTDLSGSMNATDVQPTRLDAAVSAAKTLAGKLPSTFRLGLVTFSDFSELRAAPTTDHEQVKFALDQLVADGGTAMGDGLERGLQAATTPVPGPGGT